MIVVSGVAADLDQLIVLRASRFVVVATLDDHPRGFQKLFMRKRLMRAPDEQ